MARMKENPRYNVISMRINKEERHQLENLMKQTHMSVSNIMREAIEIFVAKSTCISDGSHEQIKR
jgi:predicted DNA-binding protein